MVAVVTLRFVHFALPRHRTAASSFPETHSAQSFLACRGSGCLIPYLDATEKLFAQNGGAIICAGESAHPSGGSTDFVPDDRWNKTNQTKLQIGLLATTHRPDARQQAAGRGAVSSFLILLNLLK
jgi:hypothetical protein